MAFLTLWLATSIAAFAVVYPRSKIQLERAADPKLQTDKETLEQEQISIAQAVRINSMVQLVLITLTYPLAQAVSKSQQAYLSAHLVEVTTENPDLLGDSINQAGHALFYHQM